MPSPGAGARVLIACPLVTGIGRPRRGRRAAALAVLLTSALAHKAEAHPNDVDRLQLTWSAAPGCPSKIDLLAEVGKLLDARANEDISEKEPIPVHATVSRDADGSFVVRLETPGEGATQARELRGSTCKAVTDATALILALMIDPDAAMSPGEEEAPSETKTTDDQPEVAPPPTSAPPPDRRAPAKTQKPTIPADPARPIDIRLNAWAGADIGSLPGVAPGFGALGSIAFGVPRLSLGIAFWPDKAGTLAALPSAGSDVGLVAGELGSCAALLQKPIEIAPCAAVEIGQLFAEGFGVTGARRGAAAWVALKGGGAFAWRPFEKQAPQKEEQPFLGRVGITARFELVIPLLRPRFVIEGIGPVHSPADVAGRGALGIEITL